MTALIYDTESGERVSKLFNTLRGAKGSLTAMRKRAAANPNSSNWELRNVDKFVASTAEDYQASAAYAYSQEMVETQNILNPGKVIMIRRCDKGTASDPGTERYHTM